jgi:hypothetical protein
LLPFFPPVGGVVAHRFLRQWSFALSPINALPLPSNPFHFIILGQPSPPQGQEKPFPAPALKVFVDRAGATERLGQGLPLAAGAQNIQNGFKDLSGRHGLSAAAGFTAIPFEGLAFRLRDQRLHLGPERILFWTPVDAGASTIL